MKLLLILLFIISGIFQTNAQTSLGLRAGFNFSTARASFDGVKQTTRYVPGANFAIQLKTVFEGGLHFSPFISYNSKGFIIRADSNQTDQTRCFIHYINIVPTLSFEFKTGNSKSFFISAAPLFGLAVAGKQKTTVGGVTTSSKMKFSNSVNYGLFDLGLRGALGYNFKKIFVEAAYEHGLASINNNEEKDKRNIRNRTFSLNIGYYFRSYQ